MKKEFLKGGFLPIIPKKLIELSQETKPKEMQPKKILSIKEILEKKKNKNIIDIVGVESSDNNTENFSISSYNTTIKPNQIINNYLPFINDLNIKKSSRISSKKKTSRSTKKKSSRLASKKKSSRLASKKKSSRLASKKK